MVNNKLVVQLWNLVRQFGFDPRKMILTIKGCPKYISDLKTFRNVYNGRLRLYPCLTNWYEDAGSTKSEYFWQDLIVARWVYENSPTKHGDIGSRIDGFIAHLASFRDVDIFDIRGMTVSIPNVNFVRMDIMNTEEVHDVIHRCGAYDSLSCLHAIEHFGLGRYGDPINTIGYNIGFKNISGMLKKNGRLYLSTPIGKERVEFNANWVFNPETIYTMGRENGLSLEKCMIITEGKVKEYTEPVSHFSNWSQSEYLLCVFCFIKV